MIAFRGCCTIVGSGVGFNVTVALAVFVGSAALVAVTVIDSAASINAGAVYKPVDETVPTFGDRLHMTPELPLPVTSTLNCRLWLVPSATIDGLTPTETGSNVTTAVPD